MSQSYSYVSLLTDDSYVSGIILLVESMNRVNTQYPLHVLTTNNVSAASLEILNQLNVSYETVEPIKISDEIYQHNLTINPRIASTWEYCWTKFNIYNLTQFDKIIFLDADIMILKNLDHLFNYPNMTAAVDGEYFNIWPGEDHFNAGCMVIAPSEEEFNNILNFAQNFKISDVPQGCTHANVVADQEILNFYFKNWVDQKELHLNKYYNIFAPYAPEEAVDDLKENCYFIHFIGRKPWSFWVKNPAENYSEYFYEYAGSMIQKLVNELNWDKIKSKIILTVYAICKNEKNNVEKWLKSFGEADYICILDTGSTDGTWELLQKLKKKYKNLIIDQKIVTPWRFDKARNLSLELVPKETTMYFMADLDEVIKETGWSKKVKMVWKPTFTRGEYDYHRDVGENDVIERTIKEYRIHSKQWYKYVNIVHEALINKAGEKIFLREVSTPIDIAVWHYPDRTKNKNTSYIKLCEENLIEDPNNWLMRLQLAIEYEIAQEKDKAFEHFLYIILHPNNLQSFEIARCYYGVGLIMLDRKDIYSAMQYFASGRIICPQFFDNYLVPACLSIDNQQYEQAYELLKMSLQNCKEAFWCSVNDIRTHLPYYLLGLIYRGMKKGFKALGYFSIANMINPNNQDVINAINQIKIEIAQNILDQDI